MWDPSDLDGLATTVTAILSVGVTIAIAFATYRIGKRATGRV